jgi:hypothetical protein
MDQDLPDRVRLDGIVTVVSFVYCCTGVLLPAAVLPDGILPAAVLPDGVLPAAVLPDGVLSNSEVLGQH